MKIGRLIIFAKRFIRILICGLFHLKLFFTSLVVLKNFIYSLFINRIIFKKYKFKREKFVILCKNKLNFSHRDLFSNNIPSWLYVFEKQSRLRAKIKALEIGPFEGRSSHFLLKNFNKIHLTCVDTFKPFQELQGNYPKKFDQIYRNFKKNTSKFKKKLNIKKCTSKKFFLKNKKVFDLIYVDGSHKFLDVLNDSRSAFKILNKNGIIIFDDFLWGDKIFVKNSTTLALLKFLSENPHKFEILYLNYQIILKKII